MAQILPAQDSIRLIAFSFILASRVERVCERLDIVIKKEAVPQIDMLEIRSPPRCKTSLPLRLPELPELPELSVRYKGIPRGPAGTIGGIP